MIDKFIIATIGSPFGLDGFVKLRSASGEVDHLLKLDEVTVSKDGKEQVLKIDEALASPLAMRFAGIDTPEKAKALSGAQLVVGREYAAPLKEGEHYIEDLKGLPVVTKEGETVGHIADIIEGGGGELAEITVNSEQLTMNNEQLKREGIYTHDKPSNKNSQSPVSSPQSLKLVPFRKEFFPEIDPEKGRVVIDNLWILE